MIASSVKSAFLEDRDVLEAVQTGMVNATTRHINLGLDAAALHFRRRLEKMIDQEVPQRAITPVTGKFAPIAMADGPQA